MCTSLRFIFNWQFHKCSNQFSKFIKVELSIKHLRPNWKRVRWISKCAFPLLSLDFFLSRSNLKLVASAQHQILLESSIYDHKIHFRQENVWYIHDGQTDRYTHRPNTVYWWWLIASQLLIRSLYKLRPHKYSHAVNDISCTHQNQENSNRWKILFWKSECRVRRATQRALCKYMEQHHYTCNMTHNS